MNNKATGKTYSANGVGELHDFCLRNGPFSPNTCLCFFLPIFLGAIAVQAQNTWPIPASETRFEMQVTSRPTTPAAGIVAILPDAGILPKGKLKADVMDTEGKTLKANLLWHNPNEGLALVFEDSPSARVLIYVSPAAEYPKPVAPLKPSLMLFVHNGGKPGLDQAQALADKMPVGTDIYFALVGRIFHSLSPVGRDDNTSSYYSGWIDVRKAGKTYFYTVSKDGSEFLIDGKPGYSWPGLHGRAGSEHAEKGAWINLSAGLHQLEYCHFTQNFAGRECQLGWQQAGESQPMDAKRPDLPNLAVTGPMEEDDFTHSGVATLASANSKQGPLAIISRQWESILQPGKNPICIFNFSAFGYENLPTNTTYEWDFGNQRKIQGPKATWLFGGTADQCVSLTVSTGRSKSTCTQTFFPKSVNPAKDPPQLSINREEDRSKVRNMFLAMCNATPSGQRPAELWNATLWEGLTAVLDTSTEYALMSQLFERSRQDILGRDNTQRWFYEDIFFETLRQADPTAAIAWLNRLEKEEKSTARLGQWKARRVEFFIFDADNPSQARIAANEFAGAAGGLQQTELAMIRMGDVELYSGQQEQARRYYAQAQESARRKLPASSPADTIRAGQKKSGNKIESETLADKTNAPTAKTTSRRPSDTAAKKGGAQPTGKQKPQTAAATPSGAPVAIDAWKIAAVRESSFYSTIRNLIDQQAYYEARKALDQWELELPLDKLAGDYPLAEAEYYTALKQFKRAHKILETYRKTVDISNNLPQAMKMELYCLTKLNRDIDARVLAGEIVKRLPNHPLAAEVKNMLASAEQTGKLDIDLDAWSQDWTASENVNSAGLIELFGTKDISTTPAPTRAREKVKPVKSVPTE